MKTLYIDVYFLINLTVDILSLYFAARFTKVKSTSARLIISGIVGALSACVVVLFSVRGAFFVIALFMTSYVISAIFCRHESVLRKIKLASAFLVFETFIGGVVSFAYSMLDNYFSSINLSFLGGAENRKLLITALFVLLSYGLIKLLLLLFSGNGSEKNLEIRVELFGKIKTISALVDSGNMLYDPISSSPVIIVKRHSIESLLSGTHSKEFADGEIIKTRIRIIPSRSIGGERLFQGIRTDSVTILSTSQKIDGAIIAIDEEEGTFSGYSAIVPLAVLD